MRKTWLDYYVKYLSWKSNEKHTVIPTYFFLFVDGWGKAFHSTIYVWLSYVCLHACVCTRVCVCMYISILINWRRLYDHACDWINLSLRSWHGNIGQKKETISYHSHREDRSHPTYMQKYVSTIVGFLTPVIIRSTQGSSIDVDIFVFETLAWQHFPCSSLISNACFGMRPSSKRTRWPIHRCRCFIIVDATFVKFATAVLHLKHMRYPSGVQG